MAVSKGAPAAMLLYFATVVSGTIDKSDGGYTDILVSIHPDVTPNEDIVRNLKVCATTGTFFKSYSISKHEYSKVTKKFGNREDETATKVRIDCESGEVVKEASKARTSSGLCKSSAKESKHSMTHKLKPVQGRLAEVCNEDCEEQSGMETGGEVETGVEISYAGANKYFGKCRLGNKFGSCGYLLLPLNVQVVLKSASRFLHTATSGRVYFKKFIIEFPKSWPKRKDALTLGTSYYPKSDVRIENSSLCGGGGPYTVTSRGCGEKGDFIHLPADYLLNSSHPTTGKNESSAYTFVHEWAHLRYGVFDEYGTRGDNEFPETYCAGDKCKDPDYPSGMKVIVVIVTLNEFKRLDTSDTSQIEPDFVAIFEFIKCIR